MLEKIDNLDRKILKIVMHNARIPSKDVALVCGVSRAAIHQRLQRMIDLKVITGSGYNVNPKILGYATCTYIGVNLERGAMYREVVPELQKIPEIVECHFVTGGGNILGAHNLVSTFLSFIRGFDAFGLLRSNPLCQQLFTDLLLRLSRSDTGFNISNHFLISHGEA